MICVVYNSYEHVQRKKFLEETSENSSQLKQRKLLT